MITLRAFLFSTARNLAANEIRHRRAVERADELPGSGSVATDYESPELGFLRDERNRLVQQAIDRLPVQCRAAFTLRVFPGIRTRRWRTIWEISVKTVEKTHLARHARDESVSEGSLPWVTFTGYRTQRTPSATPATGSPG